MDHIEYPQQTSGFFDSVARKGWGVGRVFTSDEAHHWSNDGVSALIGELNRTVVSSQGWHLTTTGVKTITLRNDRVQGTIDISCYKHKNGKLLNADVKAKVERDVVGMTTPHAYMDTELFVKTTCEAVNSLIREVEAFHAKFKDPATGRYERPRLGKIAGSAATAGVISVVAPLVAVAGFAGVVVIPVAATAIWFTKKVAAPMRKVDRGGPKATP